MRCHDRFVLVGRIGLFFGFWLPNVAFVDRDCLCVDRLIVRAERFSLEQGPLSVLVATEIAAQGKDILRRILVHRWISYGADDDNGVRRIANHQHQHAEERGIEEAFAQTEVAVFVFGIEEVTQNAEDNQRDDKGLYPVAEERNAEQSDGNEIKNVCAPAIMLRSTPNCRQDYGDQK